jgi:hypothetical protein
MIIDSIPIGIESIVLKWDVVSKYIRNPIKETDNINRVVLIFLLSIFNQRKNDKEMNSIKVKEVIKKRRRPGFPFGILSTANTIENKRKHDIKTTYNPVCFLIFGKQKSRRKTRSKSTYLAICTTRLSIYWKFFQI